MIVYNNGEDKSYRGGVQKRTFALREVSEGKGRQSTQVRLRKSWRMRAAAAAWLPS